jgi:hypothetical protein
MAPWLFYFLEAMEQALWLFLFWQFAEKVIFRRLLKNARMLGAQNPEE